MSSKVNSDTKDCLACRLISGFGILGVGVYLYKLSKTRGRVEMFMMQGLAGGAAFIGSARLLNINLLRENSK